MKKYPFYRLKFWVFWHKDILIERLIVLLFNLGFRVIFSAKKHWKTENESGHQIPPGAIGTKYEEPLLGPVAVRPFEGMKIVGKHLKISPFKGFIMPAGWKPVVELERKIQRTEKSLVWLHQLYFFGSWFKNSITGFSYHGNFFHIMASSKNNFQCP